MSSEAFRNTMGVLSVARGICNVLADQAAKNPRNKAINGLTKKVKVASDEAFAMWPGSIEEKNTLTRITKRISLFEDYLGANVDDVVVGLSIAIGLLEDLQSNSLAQKKKAKVITFIKKLLSVLKYYDRKIAKFEKYDFASDSIRYWNRLEA